jgi:predicted ATPase/class 3 adenylate cyclase
MATRAKSRAPSSVRPTGTVTFLFSDIEGSTVRWEGAPDKMELALERHDALTRDAIEAHGGYVFKTMGDGFCAAFTTASEAIAAALDAQRALGTEDFSAVEGIRVRMAVHSGHCDERDGDYFGPTVNRVARLLAIGHGGQVLVSITTRELLRGALTSELSLRDLGAHQLKDLAQSEQIYQLVAAGLPDEFPPLLSLDVLPNNLPRQLTSFVGRENVAAEIKELIGSRRLITLVGTGGAGKTRCAIQIAAELLDGFDDGVWLVELAPVSDPALVTNVVAQGLNVQERPNHPMLDTLLAYLKRKRLLLILDNCEHVIDGARWIATSILHTCPDVHILATSREGLNIDGEQLYRIPSLAVPSEAEAMSSEEASRYGAVQLFADRARFADKRFIYSDENAPYIAEICRRLDGIPLAIELAAARVRVLSPRQLAQRLDKRFRVLTGGDRTAFPRHQTMRALIDWSYDLLSDDERALFRKLSIFPGSFTMETAIALCAHEAGEIVALDLLSSLVDKSLVQIEPGESGMRYRLLESTRHYARERLADAGEEDAIAHAHLSAFLALAEELDRAWETTSDRAWLTRAEPELENFRAALSWALEAQRDILLGQRLTAVLRSAWTAFAPAEGRRWVQTARGLVGSETPAPVVAALDLAEAALAAALSQLKASRTAGERALARYRDLNDPLSIAVSQWVVGEAQVVLGEVEQGEALLAQALAASRALGAGRLTGVVLRDLASARNVGDVAAARALFAQALESYRAIGADRGAAMVALNLAETEFRVGNAAEALRLARESLAVFRASNATRNLAVAQGNMAAHLTALERYDEARISSRAALTAARNAQFEVEAAFALQHLAASAALQPVDDAKHGHDDRLRAARLLGYVDALLASLEVPRQYTEQQEYDKMLPALRDALGADECAKLMVEGTRWNEDQAVAEAMLI